MGLHVIKFGGWRIQLHKHGSSVAAFTRNGHDLSSRVRWIIDALARLRGVRSFVIDGCSSAPTSHVKRASQLDALARPRWLETPARASLGAWARLCVKMAWS